MRLIVIILLFIFPYKVITQWSDDPGENLIITTLGTTTFSIANDDSTGLFLCFTYAPFYDTIPSSFPYLLKLNNNGEFAWQNPLFIGHGEDAIGNLKILPDNNGGIFVCYTAKFFTGWIDNNALFDFQIKLNRYDTYGNALWGDGVWVSVDSLSDEFDFDIMLSNQNGCFISWREYDDIHYGYNTGRHKIQYISEDGERLWGDEGITLFDGNFGNWYDLLIPIYDGNGNLIIIKSSDFVDYYISSYNLNGTVDWELPLRTGIGKLAVLNNNSQIYILGSASSGYPLPYSVKMELDVIENGSYLIDKPITVIDSVSRSLIVVNYYLLDSLISIYWSTSTYYEPAEMYYQQIDVNGALVHDGFGIVPSTIPFDSVSFRSSSSMTKSDSGFYFLFNDDRTGQGRRYVQKMSFDGNLLWSEDKLFSFADNNTSQGKGHFPKMSFDSNLLWSEDKLLSIDNIRYSREIILDDDALVSIWYNVPNGYKGQKINHDGTLGNILATVDNNNMGLKEFQLAPNYPNPFNPITTIQYELPQRSNVQISIYNLLGRKVTTLVSETQEAGSNYVIWDATSDNGNSVSAGIYFYQINAEKFVQSRKMLLLK